MDKGEEAAESIFWVEEFEGQLSAPSRTKRKYRSKKKEYLGWGSRQLIEFLQTVGKDTSNKLSQYDVTAVINEYANVNNLYHPQKKKRIVCDDNLHSLFGRKTIGRNKIHDLLSAHFAENQEDSDDDFFYSSDEKEENILPTSEQIKFSTSERKPPRKKVNLGPPKSSFAAIVPENIKLVYLRKSVVLDLLKDPETFEDKMKGSFIRIKTDPNDFLQKNSHQLLQVTGVKITSGTDDTSKDILLQVSNSINDVYISMLSDDNFSEEECKDLHQRMKDGLLKKPTIGDLEGKAHILHKDITKHWLSRELKLLQNRIDRANEKGWRKELYEYLDRRKLLQTPSEQARLFSEEPKVVAEEVGAATVLDRPDNPEREENDSPRSILRVSSETPVSQPTATDYLPTWIASGNQSAAVIDEEQRQHQKMLSFGTTQIVDVEYKGSHGMDKQIVTTQVMEYSGSQTMAGKQVLTTKVISHEGSRVGMDKQVVTTPVVEHEVGSQTMAEKQVLTTEAISHEGSVGGMDKQVVTVPVIEHMGVSQSMVEKQVLTTREGSRGGMVVRIPVTEHKGSQNLDKKVVMPEVIDLSDDDEEEQEKEKPRVRNHQIPMEHVRSMIWHYADPQGDIQGPFSMSSLKQWSDANYFPPDFMVWKKGQRQDEAVLLIHILRQMFPN